MAINSGGYNLDFLNPSGQEPFSLNRNPITTQMTNPIQGNAFGDSVLGSWQQGAPDVLSSFNTSSFVPETGWDAIKSFAGGAIGGKDNTGWLGPVAGAASNLMGAWSGLQANKLGRDQLSQNKREFDLNFANQASLVNTQLRDRQRARVSADPVGQQSVQDFMKLSGV